MKSRIARVAWMALWIGAVAVLAVTAQTNSNERSFPQSKAVIGNALKTMKSNLSGRLPALEGFANAAEHPLDRYSRGFYQATVRIEAGPSGGSLARISIKVTAWYSDPAGSQSGYKLLTSNGRLEADLLDQLSEQLAKSTPTGSGEPKVATAAHSPAAATDSKPMISAPTPPFLKSPGTFSSSVAEGLAAHNSSPDPASPATRPTSPLQAEAANLEEILKNQAHPKNLVAVKKSGTPVVPTPSLTAKPEFLASLHDEFELLDFNADWVHVRISGLSRGWIWRNSVEMPEGIPETAAAPAAALTPVADLFHVIREETAPFPGDWEPLRSKNVKIISVQKTDDAKAAGPKERLEYVKFLLEKNYPDLAKKSQELAGVVVIFDSADGGMIAATLPALQQWEAGMLSDSALWHKCFFDPPETFDSAGPAGN